MKRLVDGLISLMMEPWVSKLLGTVLMFLSPIAIMAGFYSSKYEHRVARLFHRLHSLTDGRVELPTQHGLFEQWPLIQAMLPETFIGFVIWCSLWVAGGMMVRFGKTIERMY